MEPLIFTGDIEVLIDEENKIFWLNLDRYVSWKS